MRAALLFLVLCAIPAAAAGPTAAEKCSAAKMKAATKKVAAKMACQEKAVRAETGVDPECLAKAEAAFNAAFAKAETKGGCATMGDAGAIEAKVNACVADIVIGLPATTTTSTTSTSSTTSTICSSCLPGGPILQYALDGNGINSGSISGYSLSLNGSVTFVAGKIGQAAQFATGSYGLVQGIRAVLGVYPQYTISFWVNASSPNTSNALLDFDNRSVAPYGGISLYYSSATQLSICVSTTTAALLSGSCLGFTAPPTGSWHNVVLRYAGAGTGSGQGANVDVYEDNVLVRSVSNGVGSNPVFSPGISDNLYLGTAGITLDDIRVYNSVFTLADQCTLIIGGTWNGSSCTLP